MSPTTGSSGWCSQCGSLTEPDVVFCGTCGARMVSPTPAPPPPPPPPPSQSPTPPVSLGAWPISPPTQPTIIQQVPDSVDHTVRSPRYDQGAGMAGGYGGFDGGDHFADTYVGDVPPPRRSRVPLVVLLAVLVALVGGGVAALALKSSGDDTATKDPGSSSAITTASSSATVRAAVTVAPATIAVATIAVVAPTTSTTTTTTIPATTTTTTTTIPPTIATEAPTVPVTGPPVTVAVTVAPVTFAPAPPTVPSITRPPPTRLPGDLGLRTLLTQPPCDGSYITIVASAITPDLYPSQVGDALDQRPGAGYLLTGQTCASLRPDVNGNGIYVVYFGPFATAAEACDARSQGPADAYVKRLDDVSWTVVRNQCG